MPLGKIVKADRTQKREDQKGQMIDPFTVASRDHLQKGDVVGDQGQMTVTGCIRSYQTLKDNEIVEGKQRFVQNVVGDLEIDPIVKMEGLLDKRQRTAHHDQDKNESRKAFRPRFWKWQTQCYYLLNLRSGDGADLTSRPGRASDFFASLR